MSSISTSVFSYCGLAAYFSVASELRDMREYPKAAAIANLVVTGTLLTIAIVVYYFCGSFVASPALGSAGPLMKKISYGLALPGVLITGTIITHVRLFQPATSCIKPGLIKIVVRKQACLCSHTARLSPSHF